MHFELRTNQQLIKHNSTFQIRLFACRRYGGFTWRHEILHGCLESGCRLHGIAKSDRRPTRSGTHFVWSTRIETCRWSPFKGDRLLLGHYAAGRLLELLWKAKNVSHNLSSIPCQWKFNSQRLICSYHHTISPTLLYGLREALAAVSQEGLAEIICRHEDTAAHLQAGLKRMGLELYVSNAKYRMPTITAIKVPKGADWKAIIDYAANKYVFQIDGFAKKFF